jgi:hypothetical protein
MLQKISDFLWKLTVFALIAVTALVAQALFLTAFCGCGAEAQRLQNLDNGRTVLFNGRVHVQPLPVYVDCTCSDIDCPELAEAAGWWNEQMAGHGHEEPVVLVSAIPMAQDRPHLCIQERELPPGVYSEEVAHYWEVTSDGLETSALGRAYAYVHPRHWWPAVIRHAIGHYMGLTEDPPTSVTVDLRSIMQSDAPPWGEVTPGDAYLLMHPHEALTGLEEW